MQHAQAPRNVELSFGEVDCLAKAAKEAKKPKHFRWKSVRRAD
jgi:hypothetical protein